MKANMAFDGIQVKAKAKGKGATKSTKVITDDDLERISDYLMADHTTKPNPKVLQHCVQFYIMYFFCRHGQENLYVMTKFHFDVDHEPDGTRFVYQAIDEKDKNHGVKDTKETNQARMYDDPGE